MSQLIIRGNRPLRGKVKPQGNKNSILPIMAAALLTQKECVLENVPKIHDVVVLGTIINQIGGEVKGLGTGKLTIKAARVKTGQLPENLVQKLRASILLIGPLLARKGEVKTTHPGGCIIGKRAVGTHFDALRAMGAEIKGSDDQYEAKVSSPRSAKIFLDEASVTATENALLLASTISSGTTVIKDAASEPHVEELCHVLEKMGATINGQGSNLLKIKGRGQLSGFRHRIWPDHVDVGSLAIAAAVTKGKITIEEVRPEDLSMILAYLSRFGVKYKLENNALTVFPSKLHAPKNGKRIQTRPWPGFPTDLMSPLVALATQAEGVTLCHDWMYQERLYFVGGLISMGANITTCDPHRVLVQGPTKLSGKNLYTPDIRAGMAMVVAALCAQGESIINDIDTLYRGYEDVASRLKTLGAEVKEVIKTT